MTKKETKKTQMDVILSKLENIKETIDNQLDDMLSTDDLLEYLKISKSHLYKLTGSGKIPFYKPFGKKLYFSRKEINKWIKTYFEKDTGGITDEQ